MAATASEFLTFSSVQQRSSLLSRKLCSFPPKQRVCYATGRKYNVISATMTENFVKADKPKAFDEKSAKSFKVRAVVTVKRKINEGLKESISNRLDAFSDKIGRNIVLELVSSTIDPRTKKPKVSSQAKLKDWFEKRSIKADRVMYSTEFVVDSAFGEPGAILVVNQHQKEFFLDNIIVEGFPSGPIHFICGSWVQPTRVHPQKRIFFTNKPYLPSETPPGLRVLRDNELKELRGDGKGERKFTDRVYDYDTYNDLGDPDKGFSLSRPTLGGENIPYPRRLRTGRAPTSTDSRKESKVEDPNPIYVPRDEQFEEGKQDMLSAGALKALLHNIVPQLVSSIAPESRDFNGFHDIDNLFKEGVRLKKGLQDHLWKKIPFVSSIQESSEGLLRYDTPQIISKDKFAWLRDDEFARQALAGINPVNIQRLQTFPPRSKLDPEIYGPQESAIKENDIIGHLNGLSVQQALEENRLYMLDYHDTYLPFIDRINAQDGRKAYATRTLFFLSDTGTLKPVAIELCLPQMGPNTEHSRRVMTPPSSATGHWLWQMAKAHVCSNDAGVHQLVNHWLKTHSCIEPFIIAAHRQLSAMHPIFKLLKPHMRYTLEINGQARQILISAGGIIENGFTPGSSCMEISAAAYKDWRFDQEGLPADLVRRGMAVEDPSQPHGIKLMIKDYPYASDGLLLWSTIENWVKTYISKYYQTPSQIQQDAELQSWYAESIYVGHADKATHPGWPPLATPSDLTYILTTLIWLCSAQHAALNFGQYPLGGYIPNRPPLMRRLIPSKGDPDYKNFISDPHKFYLSALPSLTQTTTFMTVLDTLSTHSSDEEYIGERRDPYTWTGDEEMVEAFHSFGMEIKKVEKEISRRNMDPELKNRCGAGVLPYELMAPSSKPGITCRGVPNSVSI